MVSIYICHLFSPMNGMTIATVTSKKMVVIPAEIRRKYGIKEGTKVKFIDKGNMIVLVPIPSLKELFSVDKTHYEKIVEGVRELMAERREEAHSEEIRG